MDSRLLATGWRAGASLVALLLTAAPARATEFHVSALLDLVAAERGPAFQTNLLTREDALFDAYGLRVFADAKVNDRLQVFSHLVLRDATSPYVDGAYLDYTPSPAHDMHVLAGKIPWPIGTYAPRTYSNKNPLIGAPLMYQYHTTLLWYEVPPSADALIAASGSGQSGVTYPGFTAGFGMPIVDDSYWDVGITVSGSQRPFEYAVGVVSGTPGWGSTSQDENGGKTVLARIGWLPIPGLRVGASGAWGPYLVQDLNPFLPAGRDVGDYHQKLAMGDLEIQVGHLELRAEGALNTWESPTVGDLDVTGGYAELKYSLSSGAFLAGRYDVLQFGDIEDGGGNDRRWDAHVRRIEVGAGYRFDRSVVGKIVHQQTHLDFDEAVGPDRTPKLAAAQLSISF